MSYKFSVIIPIYNAEKTICRCLDSLISQNDGSAQIVLVNDGSTDNSAQLCRQYAQNNLHIQYIEQENAGVSAARNAGLMAATGEYVTFVDSDDYVADGYFEELNLYDEDLVVFALHTIRGDGEYDQSFSSSLLQESNHQCRILEVIKSRLAGPVDKRFRRSIIENQNIKFKKELTIGEDFIFGLEYMLACQTSIISEKCLYCVDETGMESITRAARYDYFQFAKIYEYAFSIADNCAWGMEEKRKLLKQLDYLYCRTAFAATKHCLTGNKKDSVNDFLRMYFEMYHSDIQPLNLVHRIMRVCIKCRLYPVFVIVARLHMRIQ